MRCLQLPKLHVPSVINASIAASPKMIRPYDIFTTRWWYSFFRSSFQEKTLMALWLRNLHHHLPHIIISFWCRWVWCLILATLLTPLSHTMLFYAYSLINGLISRARYRMCQPCSDNMILPLSRKMLHFDISATSASWWYSRHRFIPQPANLHTYRPSIRFHMLSLQPPPHVLNCYRPTHTMVHIYWDILRLPRRKIKLPDSHANVLPILYIVCVHI